MKLLRKIREIKSRLSITPKLDETFVFPYSIDKLKKRNEMWDNLQNGLLLEDDKILIPWKSPFNRLNRYKEKRRDSGDRTEWYFGEHEILGGYKCNITAMMWMYLPWTNPFERISVFLGFGNEGHANFKKAITHLNDLLGEPTRTDIRFVNDNFTDGTYEWKNRKVLIQVFGFDMHGARYTMTIGLIYNKNEEFLKKEIEKYKAQGLTEEDLGK